MSTSDSLRVTARGDLEIEIARTFDAPCDVVFEAMTRPELLARWLTGPPGWTTSSCESDPRPGGAHRQEWRGPDGARLVLRGTYREVAPPSRIVRTEIFELGCDPQGGEQVATLTLEESDGGAKTVLRNVVRYPSREARDGALASGMEQGLAAGYAALDAEVTERAG